MANKGKKSVFNGISLKDFATKVQNALNDSFGTDNPFVARNIGEDIVFVELQDNKKGTLKKVVVTNIPTLNENEYVWFMDKWDETATGILKTFGLQNKSKGVDGIIFSFINNTLNVYLIELKSSMNDDNLTSCYEKFIQTIGKLALYICVNAWEHRENTIFNTAKIKFKGIVFYNGGRNNVSQKPTESIFNSFHNPNQTGKVICDTLLGKDEIEIKFILRENQSEITIGFSEL